MMGQKEIESEKDMITQAGLLLVLLEPLPDFGDFLPTQGKKDNTAQKTRTNVQDSQFIQRNAIDNMRKDATRQVRRTFWTIPGSKST